VLEANLDDLNPQIIGYVMDRLFEEGTLDAFAMPVQMKKSRPGTLLTVLCKPEDAAKLTRIIFTETTTLGVRRRDEMRQTLARRWESVSTPWGEVRMKIASMNGTVKFYITTPIYYVNARPHIGHTYTTVVCDAIARRQRMMGVDTWFLTGTDEHGQKIERSARLRLLAAGVCRRVSGEFRALWERMKITNDDFIRTTEPRHMRGVQALFTRLQERGYIYKGSYSGQYCVSDELYVDAVGEPGAPCPECGRPTETVHEENYFFKLSAMGSGC
jgi:leucyl-tRNA synthetase